jgi:hypothetical protein
VCRRHADHVVLHAATSVYCPECGCQISWQILKAFVWWSGLRAVSDETCFALEQLGFGLLDALLYLCLDVACDDLEGVIGGIDGHPDELLDPNAHVHFQFLLVSLAEAVVGCVGHSVGGHEEHPE